MAYSHQELEAWTTDFALPTTVWLAGFFNPQSFLTAIMQSMARKNEWPLDKMCLSVEVTKKNREDMTAPPREGAYVYGLFMEGKGDAAPAGLEERQWLEGRVGPRPGAGRGWWHGSDGTLRRQSGARFRFAKSGVSTCFKAAWGVAPTGQREAGSPGAARCPGAPATPSCTH